MGKKRVIKKQQQEKSLYIMTIKLKSVLLYEQNSWEKNTPDKEQSLSVLK